MPDIRTLYAIPDDILITGIHCMYKQLLPGEEFPQIEI